MEEEEGDIEGGEGTIEETRIEQEQASDGSGGGGGAAAGGPLAVPGFVSGRINVRDFQRSCLDLISSVKFELDCSASVADDTIDVSIDDLRVLTDALLVEKALAEVCMGQDHALLTAGAANTSERLSQGAGEDNVERMLTAGAANTTELLTRGAGVGHLERMIMAGAANNKDLPTQGAGEDLLQTLALPAPGAENNGRVEFRVSVPPKTGKKRGRPFDRDLRAAAFFMDGEDSKREEALSRLKREREAAKESAPLLSLMEKRNRERLYTKDQRPLRTLKFLNPILKTPKLASKEHFEPMEEGEVLLTVEIYDNTKRQLKTQEFIVCGSQPLTALKDRIYCLSDTIAEKARLSVPSSYFLIEDVFYNDMRDSSAVDYSLPIRRWVKEKSEAIEKWKALGGADLPKKQWLGAVSCRGISSQPPSFSAAHMADVCFNDMECRLGAQFLYCHQGDCKHTIVIRDMRLVHPQDVQNAAAYPLLRYVHKVRHRKCTICSIYQASKVTSGDKLAPESPCFFCNNCYYLLHYSSDGTLLYSDFEVHNYYHDQA